MDSTARQPEPATSFAERVVLSVKTIIRNRDMSQAELARGAGMSEAQVSRRLHGNVNNLTLNEALGMAKALDRPLDELLDPEAVAEKEFKLVQGLFQGQGTLPGVGAPDLRVLKGDR